MTETLAYTLPDTLEFNDDDLAHNRDGHISDRQRMRLRQARGRLARLRVAMILALMFVTAAFLALGQQNEDLVLQLLGVITSILNAFVVGLLLRGWLRFSADLEHGRVESLQGEVGHTIRVTGRAASYVLNIANEEINVPKEVFFAFDEGTIYRLYRATHSKLILSVEQVDV